MKIRLWMTCSVMTATLMLAPVFSFSQTPSSSGDFVNNLMPQPASLTSASGSFVLTPQFSAAATHFDNPRLDGAIQTAMQQLRQKTSLPLSLEKTASSRQPVDGRSRESRAGDSVHRRGRVLLALRHVLPAYASRRATVVGAMRGLATLVQLVQPSGKTTYCLPSRSRILRASAWRGLMIDCGRHFEPVDVLKRTLDGMAAVKLNVFHWHLTEDQGFRIESKLYPKLTGVGSDGLFYTQEDAREIVRYARARGIRVVPEFEMPGHSTAWQFAYPELASGTPPSTMRREFGISPFAMDPTREETYQFIDAFPRRDGHHLSRPLRPHRRRRDTRARLEDEPSHPCLHEGAPASKTPKRFRPTSTRAC